MLFSMLFQTPRLMLTGADAPILDADLAGRDSLQIALGVSVPEDWPPELLDPSALRWTRELLGRLPAYSPWRMYYVVLESPTRTLIGICGFKGAPDAEGQVEIGYSVLPAYQRRGFATEAARALIGIALACGAKAVMATTFPELMASVRVMEVCGLQNAGPGDEPGTVKYRLAFQSV